MIFPTKNVLFIFFFCALNFLCAQVGLDLSIVQADHQPVILPPVFHVLVLQASYLQLWVKLQFYSRFENLFYNLI